MRADPARFAQIVSNLLQHALQRCVSTGVTEPIELLARLSETGITIEISDQATAPLPPRDVLFPDLTGLRVVAGGTDLAMAVVRELTDDMGGSIQVQTQAPGATVLVSLPLKQRPEAAASLPPMLLHEPDAIQDSGQTPN